MNKTNNTAWVFVILIVMGFGAIFAAVCLVAVGGLFFADLNATQGPMPMPSQRTQPAIAVPEDSESLPEMPEVDMEEPSALE